MGARSRRRRGGSAGATPGPAPADAAPPGRADDARTPRPAAGDASGEAGDDTLRRGYARGRARADEVRAGLEPLAPGERPGAVTVAAVVAFALAIANAAAALSGRDIATRSGDPSLTTAVTTLLLVVAGAGMLARQYWAVLGFQTILALQIILFSLYLIGVQTLWQALVPLVAIGLMGWLFWKLVRAMARLQMPQRPGRDAPP